MPAIRVRRFLRPLVSLVFLGIVAWILDLGEVAGLLGDMRPGWIALALGVSVAQVALSAWRWRFTAGRLGLELPFGRAVREYYLSGILNQVLPGGVMGDVSRAWRHARDSPRTGAGPAVRAVILERASGQLIMTAVGLGCLISLLLMGATPGAVVEPVDGTTTRLILPLGALFLILTFSWTRVRARAPNTRTPQSGAEMDPGPGIPSRRAVFWADTRRALLSRETLPVQMVGSLLVVASYVAIFVLGARALGIMTPLNILLPLVPPVLLAMLLPIGLAGWGVREGAAALVWAAAGLPASQGVAISVAYGLLVLVATLPGLLVFPGGLIPGRGRTEGPRPGSSGGTAHGSPRRASGSDPG